MGDGGNRYRNPVSFAGSPNTHARLPGLHDVSSSINIIYPSQRHIGAANISRYEPDTLNRITDITDLVDNDSSSDDDDIVGRRDIEMAKASDGNGKRKRRREKNTSAGQAEAISWCRQATIVFSFIAILAAASSAIGYAIVNSQGKEPYSIDMEGGDSRGTNVDPDSISLHEQERAERQQDLLESAEGVVSACSQSGLESDPQECYDLCDPFMCCFMKGQNACDEERGSSCPVYAGCEALMEDVRAPAEE